MNFVGINPMFGNVVYDLLDISVNEVGKQCW